MTVTFPVDFNAIRTAFARSIYSSTGLTAMLEQPETQNVPRPGLPYIGFRIQSPAIKSGDDSHEYDPGTGLWKTGGVRKMVVVFDSYGSSHEEAYNYLTLWQCYLDTAPIREYLRAAGIAIWVIGNVADLSQLLNTGFEGRAHLEVSCGIAVNLSNDLGSMETAVVQGHVNTDQKTVVISTTVP